VQAWIGARSGSSERESRYGVPMTRVTRHLLLAGGFAAALVGLLACAYFVEPFERVDAISLDGLRTLSENHRSIYVLCNGVAHSVDLPFMALILATLVGLGISWGRRRQAIAAVAVVAASSLLTILIKAVAAHPRHNSILAGHQLSPSAFPSGHATAAMSLALAAVIVVPSRWRPVTAMATGCFTLAVSVSLIVQSWHFPSDVLGGFLVVGLVTMLAIAALEATGEDSPGRYALARHTRLRTTAIRALQLSLSLLAIAAGVLLASHPDALGSYVAAHTTAVAASLAIGAAALAIVSGVTAELEAG
jgi:membrane-associated phospholipid phosphatase